MKKAILLIVWTVFISCAAVAQPAATAFHGISAPKVDRRLELVTIVARLAGLREFQSELVPPYTDSVDAWFAPYREHPVVQHMRQLRQTKRWLTMRCR